MTQHLIPTVITDRTGKVTTVYRSIPKSNNPSGKPIPVPSAATSVDAKTLRASIAYNVASINAYNPSTTRDEEVVDALETMDMELLRSLHESFNHLREVANDQPALRPNTAFRELLEANDREGMSIVIEHGYKTSGHNSLSETVAVVKTLKSMDDEQHSFMENLDAHLDAAGKLTYVSGSGNPDFNYHQYEDLIRFINKHPDKVDDVLQFRLEFKLAKFSEEAFQEWMSAGVLRDGFL